jgi:hypothetical protein
MKKFLVVVVGLLMLWNLIGCSEDPRLIHMAQQSVETQRQQNEWIARQSQAVVAESAKLAETAKALVEHEAQARADILAAQCELQSQATVIENERRELMDLRIREPVIAETLKLIGGTFLCCLPLALVGLLVWRQPTDSEIDVQLNQLLIREISGASSLLLGGAQQKLLQNPTTPKLAPPAT